MPRKKVDNREAKESIARMLMGRYTTGVVLALYTKASAPPEGSNLTLDGNGAAHTHTIYWDPREPLTIFLHELGHTLVGEKQLGLLGEVSGMARDIFEEAWAWRLAEGLAIKEGIYFDYLLAEKKYNTYTNAAGLAPLRMAWERAR